MAIHYRASSDRFYTDKGKRVSKQKAMRSSVARREYEAMGFEIIAELFARISDVPIEEIVSPDIPSTSEALGGESSFKKESTGLDFDAEEDTLEDVPDYSNEYSADSGEYLDELFDDVDVDTDEKDSDGKVV